jgi:hypothetical protein
VAQRVQPIAANVAALRKLYTAYRRVYPAMKSIFPS